MMSCQSSAEPGSVPCSGSVAEPLKLIVWLTPHIVPAAGVSIVAVGVPLAALIVSVSSSNAPLVSVTRSLTW